MVVNTLKLLYAVCFGIAVLCLCELGIIYLVVGTMTLFELPIWQMGVFFVVAVIWCNYLLVNGFGDCWTEMAQQIYRGSEKAVTPDELTVIN